MQRERLIGDTAPEALELEQALGASNYFIERGRELFTAQLEMTSPYSGELSKLMCQGAEFEMRLGNVDTAIDYARHVTRFHDKLTLFKAAYEAGEVYIAAALGDLEQEAAASEQPVRRLYDYHLLFASLGLSPAENLDASLVLATDSSLNDGKESDRLTNTAITAAAQGEMAIVSTVLQKAGPSQPRHAEIEAAGLARQL